MPAQPSEDAAHLIRELYRITDRLEESFGRPFTLDGHLIGSLGETYAAEMFGLTLMPPSNEGFDAVTEDGSIRVEVKTTQRGSVSLSTTGTGASHLVVLSIDRQGNPTVEYNGPSSLAWARAGKPQKTGQRRIAISSLRHIMSELPINLQLGHQRRSADSQARVELFLYGTLMPGQGGHHVIEDVVDSVRSDAVLADHELITRDGMPFVRERVDALVNGVVVVGGPDLEQRVRRFEGLCQESEPKLYREASVLVSFAGSDEHHEVTAYLQKGAAERDDSEPVLSGRWDESSDPVLRKGFPALFEETTRLLAESQQPTSPESSDYWPRMWQMQGVYLSLSSVLERFSLFVFGRGTGPTQAMKELDRRETEAIREALSIPEVEVYSMRDRSNTPTSSSEKPFQTWYQVRSNLVHQGKSVRDFKRIRVSVHGLNEALALVLARRVPHLVDRWQDDLPSEHPILEFLSAVDLAS